MLQDAIKEYATISVLVCLVFAFVVVTSIAGCERANSKQSQARETGAVESNGGAYLGYHLMYRENGLVGLLDGAGKIVVPLEFRTIEAEIGEEGLLFATRRVDGDHARARREQGEPGFIDPQGNFTALRADASPFHDMFRDVEWSEEVVLAYCGDGVFQMVGKTSCAVLDSRGLLDDVQTRLGLDIAYLGEVSYGYVPFTLRSNDDSDAAGYLTRNGEIAVPPHFSYVAPFFRDPAGELRAVVRVDADRLKGGLIDKNGDFVVPPVYPANTAPSAGLQGFMDQSMIWKYINTHTGEDAFAQRFGGAGPFRDGRAAVQDAETGLVGYINMRGEYVLPPRYVWAGTFSEGRSIVREEPRRRLLDVIAGWVGAGERMERDRTSYCIIDDDGAVICEFASDRALEGVGCGTEFIGGVARIDLVDDPGLIDKDGSWIVRQSELSSLRDSADSSRSEAEKQSPGR